MIVVTGRAWGGEGQGPCWATGWLRPGGRDGAGAVRAADGSCRGGLGGRALGPGSVQCLGEGFGRLTAGEGVAAVDDEEGHAGGSEAGSFLFVGADGVEVGVGVVKDAAGLVLVDSGLQGQVEEGVGGEDGACLGKVGVEEQVQQLVLAAVCLGEVQEAVASRVLPTWRSVR